MPRKIYQIFEPLKSTINGLLLESLVLKTSTAFPVSDVVVGGAVAVVTFGVVVGERQSKVLQGHPAEQFSYEMYWFIYGIY